MGFLDKLKSTAGNAMAAASDAARNVQDKGKEMTEKARLNKAIKNEESKINNLYIYIGQKFFNENNSAPAGYEDPFNGINNAKAEIERLKKELDSMNASSNCPQCGAKINPGQPFCQCCGSKLTSDSSSAPEDNNISAEEAAPVQSQQTSEQTPQPEAAAENNEE